MRVYESVSELINEIDELIDSKFDDVVSELVKNVDDYKIVFYDIDDIYLVFKVNMCLFVRKIVIYNNDVDLFIDEDYEKVLMDLIFG